MGAVLGNWYERVGQDWSGMQGGCCGVGGAVFGNDGWWGWVGGGEGRIGVGCREGVVEWVGQCLGMMDGGGGVGGGESRIGVGCREGVVEWVGQCLGMMDGGGWGG